MFLFVCDCRDSDVRWSTLVSSTWSWKRFAKIFLPLTRTASAWHAKRLPARISTSSSPTFRRLRVSFPSTISLFRHEIFHALIFDSKLNPVNRSIDWLIDLEVKLSQVLLIDWLIDWEVKLIQVLLIDCLIDDFAQDEKISFSHKFQMNLMEKIRQSIKAGQFPEFVVKFMEERYPNGSVTSMDCGSSVIGQHSPKPRKTAPYTAARRFRQFNPRKTR